MTVKRILLTLCLLVLSLASSSVVVRAGAARGQDAVAEARARAIKWLHEQQLPDGSFGVRLPDGSFEGNAAATSDVVYVLGLAGEDPGGPAWTVGGHTALDGLAAQTPDFARADAGQAGKVARSVVAAGRDPHAFAGLDLPALIAASYNPASGRYHNELLFRHTLAIEGLARAGARVPPEAFDALTQARLADGSWFWAFGGQDGDLDTTGYVVQILATYGGLRCAPYLLASSEYLARQQAAGGAWGVSIPPGPPNANSTAMALAGLQAAGYDLHEPRFARGGRDPLASLLAFQEPSGAFVYIPQPGREEVRIAATTDALSALEPEPASQARSCEVTYYPLRLAS